MVGAGVAAASSSSSSPPGVRPAWERLGGGVRGVGLLDALSAGETKTRQLALPILLLTLPTTLRGSERAHATASSMATAS